LHKLCIVQVCPRFCRGVRIIDKTVRSVGEYNVNGDQVCRACNTAQQLQAQCQAQYVFALEGVWLAVDSATGNVVPLACSAPLCAAGGDIACPLTKFVTVCIAEAKTAGRLPLTTKPFDPSAQAFGLVSNYSEAINSCGANRAGFLCGACAADYFGVWNGDCVGASCSASWDFRQ
jgi:hypothetical protein